jgi:heptose-I-phosphate ethanolaminephosphotransferase
MAAESGGASFVLYFADHGQEVYDTLPIREQDAKHPTRNMFDVPFIIWMSAEYERLNPDLAARVKSRLAAPFSLAWFADTAAELSGVGYDGVTFEHSLFAPDYQPPDKREISYGGNYDNLLLLEL